MSNHITRYEGLIASQTFDKVTSKLQKQFVQNLKRLEALKVEVAEAKAFERAVEVQVAKDIAPLHRKYNQRLGDMLLILDTHYGALTDEENYKLGFYIATMVRQLLASGLQHLQPLYDKYQEYLMSDSQEIDTPAEEEEEEEDIPEEWNEQDSRIFGQVEETLPPITNKTARSIYMELVKEFHPDLESDEEEKLRKTKLMHLITEAYSKNDLYELLKLRMTLITEQEKPQTFVEPQLKRYNKILIKQILFLEKELKDIQSGAYWQFGRGNYKTMDISIITEMNSIKKATKQLEFHKQVLKSKEYVVQFLSNY
ncbi:hypothetical protein QM480_10155 [Flectobacillus sp. DC10W]|uniref:J domain-containing protein n=1 Tax=Flectobacillus longus TaxID=2984207 RepID=A0ABT6YNE4_9BACT|nr:hypothetical protein [Flectobacillus longus]MDI9864686.1 hypothetical protein [Flectobacillus longus]